MIFTENLTKHFDGFPAVESVNLEVSAGQVMVLLGPNGAGKTTTVRMLTSILLPTSGRASVGGYDVVRQASKVRSAVGVLTEHHGLYGRMNAQEYLLFFAQLYQINQALARARMSELLAKLGLADVGKKRLGEYSKGMRQKLALVRALLHDPPILLLDEPTSAMDPESAHLVRDAIQKLRSRDRTIVLCTHNLAEAEALADRVAIMRQGRILIEGTPESLKEVLLGPPEFEACLAQEVDGLNFDLPPGARLTAANGNRLRFQVDNPAVANPQILRLLLQSGKDVVSFAQVPRLLEQAYLEAIRLQNEGGPIY